MAFTQESEGEQFAEAQDAFGQLRLDKKAEFLVTESVKTAFEVVSWIADAAGREFSNLCGSLTSKEYSKNSSQNSTENQESSEESPT